MNKQYVAMAIRQILTNYGDGITNNHSAFKAAVYDFVNETLYPEERKVIKHAMEAPAFWRLLSATFLTAEEAENFIEQIIRESYMSREGAKFIVECVAEARGGIKSNNSTEKTGTESKGSNNFPRNSAVGKENNYREEADSHGQEQIYYQNNCKLRNKGDLKGEQGVVQLYQNKLRWISKKDRRKWGDISYQEIMNCKINYMSVPWYAAMIGIVGIYILIILALNYYHWETRTQILSDDVAVIMGIAGSLLIIIMGIAVGFPVLVTKNDQTAFYMRVGGIQKQLQLKKLINKGMSQYK